MTKKRTWIVAGTTLAVAGFAGAGIAMASDDVDLKDQKPVPVVQLTGDTAQQKIAAADDRGSASSVGSANSAHSANSADSPGEPGYQAPAPAPAKAEPAPAKAVAPARVADSGDSPSPAKYRPAPVYSADSPAGGGSADSGD